MIAIVVLSLCFKDELESVTVYVITHYFLFRPILFCRIEAIL